MSYRERLTSWWQASRLNPARAELTESLGSAYQKQINQLGVGNIPWNQRPSDQPNFQWANRVNTRQGSVVPSPSVDDYLRYWRLGQSPDVLVRREAYREFDEIFATSVIVRECADELSTGAFGQDHERKVICKPGYENDPKAQDDAALMDDQFQRITEQLDPEWWRLLDAYLIRYGNAPIEIVPNDLGIIQEFVLLSPKAMQINSDYQLKFGAHQQVAYAQYDDVSRNFIAGWPEALIIWAMTKDLAEHRYGTSQLFPALTCARALIRAEATLPNSREAAQLEKFERYADAAGNPVGQDVIDEARLQTRDARIARGEQVTAFSTRIYNGAVEVGIHEPGTAFFKDIEDVKWHAGSTAMRFGTQLARKLGGENGNRAVLDRLDEMAYAKQYQHFVAVTSMVYPQILTRMVAWYNAALNNQVTFYGGVKAQNTIDISRLKVEAKAQAQFTPDQLAINGQAVINGYKEGLVDWETAVEKYALTIGENSEKLKQRLIAAGKAPSYLTQQEKPANPIRLVR